jgi:hypothetical protein
MARFDSCAPSAERAVPPASSVRKASASARSPARSEDQRYHDCKTARLDHRAAIRGADLSLMKRHR